jgi:hypothetical protein
MSREGDDRTVCSDTGSHGSPLAHRAEGWKSWLAVVVVYIVAAVLLETSVWRPDEVFGARNNTQIAEAESWWNGRLDLAEKQWDTATVGARHYSHFPILFSVIAAAAVPLFGGVPHWLVLVVVVLPIPVLAFRLFRTLVGCPGWAALLTIGLLCGTSLWPVLDQVLRGATPYHVNHALATIGLLVLLGEVFGKRRLWLACAGLLIAALSRQLTIAFILPLCLMAWDSKGGGRRARRFVPLLLVVLVACGVPAIFNSLKFGHPLDTGYLRIYENRDDALAEKARQHGLFAARFVPENLYHMNVGLPRLHRIEMAGKEEIHIRPNRICTGIWWTTPILLFLFFDLRRILSDSRCRSVLLAAAVILTVLLFFHGAGQDQRGFNRFSLDFLPGLLALVAPVCVAGRARWISPFMVAWSVLYFGWLI